MKINIQRISPKHACQQNFTNMDTLKRAGEGKKGAPSPIALQIMWRTFWSLPPPLTQILNAFYIVFAPVVEINDCAKSVKEYAKDFRKYLLYPYPDVWIWEFFSR